jgi:LCP family protein required for cell wall assembly
LDRDLPVSQSRAGAYSDAYTTEGGRHWNLPLTVGIVLFALVSFYAALVVVSQVDQDYLPGNELKLPIVVKDLPGVSDDECSKEGGDRRINILLMGLDLRRDEPEDMPARTDTVAVMTIEKCAKTAGVLSIPRDLLVDIPVDEDYIVSDRINTAYERGEMREKGSGPQVAMDTIELNFGIEIDYYAILNFNNFIEIIDELGGITVDVPEYVYDPAYSDCNACPYYEVEFTPGPTEMDGETALAYVRLRKSDNDFKRIERQQLVMRAIAKKAASLEWLGNPAKAKSLYDKYKNSVKTNIRDSELPGLALLSRDVGVDNIRMESLAEAVYPCPYSVCGGAAMLLPIEEKVQEIINRIFGDPRLQSENAVIKIINGTTIPDLGAQLAAFLRTQGIDSEHVIVDELANGQLYETTIVIDLAGKKYTAQKLAEWLKIQPIRLKSADELTSGQLAQFNPGTATILVVLGADAQVPEVEEPEVPVEEYIPPEPIFEEETPMPEPTDQPVFEPEPTPEPTEAPEPTLEPIPTPEPPPEPTEAPQPTEPAAGG